MNYLNQYENWWESNLGSDKYLHNGEWYGSPSVSSFEEWMGDHNSADRVKARSLLLEYDSILDAGCGAAPEHRAVLSNKYVGLDITQKLVDYNRSRGINCVQGTLNSIPFTDNSFDVSISRHVIEHMKDIEKPLDELIRVSKKQVLIFFFIMPQDTPNHQIVLDNKNTQWELYHNIYSKIIIEQQLNNNNKVNKYEWINGAASTLCYLNILLSH